MQIYEKKSFTGAYSRKGLTNKPTAHIPVFYAATNKAHKQSNSPFIAKKGIHLA